MSRSGCAAPGLQPTTSVFPERSLRTCGGSPGPTLTSRSQGEPMPDTSAAVEPGSDDGLDELYIVDCDAHLTEPADLWSSRASAALRDRMPAMKTIDGKTAWYLDGELWASTGGNTIATDQEKILGSHVIQPFERIDV